MIYAYKSTIVSVYDGDTCTVNIDLGLGLSISKKKIRLYGINTPEIRGKGAAEKKRGIKARNFFRRAAPNGSTVIVRTRKDKSGKYGRLLGEIFFDPKNSNLCDRDLNWLEEESDKYEYVFGYDNAFYCLNDILVDKGLAVEYMKK